MSIFFVMHPDDPLLREMPDGTHVILQRNLPPTPPPAAPEANRGWLEAAVAWEVCASIHEKWAKGKDALYTTRHGDFVKHAADARAKALAAPKP